MKITIIMLSILLILCGLGCVSLSSLITPATIDDKAIDYAAEAQIIDPLDYSGYPNLDKAIRLESAVGKAHQSNQLSLQQLMEKDDLTYSQLNETVMLNRQIGQQREDLLFGEEGLLTLGLSMAGFGTLTGLIGLMRKRPGDLTPQEMEKAVEGIKGEVSDKDRQLIEIVKGVQEVLKTSEVKENGLLQKFKLILGNFQSADTKETVAKIKTTL